MASRQFTDHPFKLASYLVGLRVALAILPHRDEKGLIIAPARLAPGVGRLNIQQSGSYNWRAKFPTGAQLARVRAFARLPACRRKPQATSANPPGAALSLVTPEAASLRQTVLHPAVDRRHRMPNAWNRGTAVAAASTCRYYWGNPCPTTSSLLPGHHFIAAPTSCRSSARRWSISSPALHRLGADPLPLGNGLVPDVSSGNPRSSMPAPGRCQFTAASTSACRVSRASSAAR